MISSDSRNIRMKRFWTQAKNGILDYMLTASGPVILSTVYGIPPLKMWIKKVLTNFEMMDFVSNWKDVFILILLVVIPLITQIIKRCRKDSLTPDRNKLFAYLLTHINTIIEAKKKRFSENSVNCCNVTKGKIFDSITQPRSQMTEIIKNTACFFEKMYNIKSVMPSLLYTEDMKKIDYFIYFEAEHKTGSNDLSDGKSTAMTSIKTGEIQIIEDTEKKDINFKHPSCGKTKIKSLICYPVELCENKRYIICLTSKEKNSFKESLKSEYVIVLEEFATRIMLEYYLFKMKESAK